MSKKKCILCEKPIDGKITTVKIADLLDVNMHHECAMNKEEWKKKLAYFLFKAVTEGVEFRWNAEQKIEDTPGEDIKNAEVVDSKKAE